MSKFDEYTDRARRIHGEKFNPGCLDPRFVRYFESGERIRVNTCGMIVTGTVGVTSGWQPVFLLMRTKRSIGSSWTLGARDTILARKVGRAYVPARDASLNHGEN